MTHGLARSVLHHCHLIIKDSGKLPFGNSGNNLELNYRNATRFKAPVSCCLLAMKYQTVIDGNISPLASRSHTHSPDVLDESNASTETKATHTGPTQTPTPPPTCPTPSENGFADRAEFQWLNMHECKAAVLVAQRLSLIGPLGPTLPSRALPNATGD